MGFVVDSHVVRSRAVSGNRAVNALAQQHKPFVRQNKRVGVNTQSHARFFRNTAFERVAHGVHVGERHVRGEHRIRLGYFFCRAVIVDNKVVHRQHARVGRNYVLDLRVQLGIGAFAEQPTYSAFEYAHGKNYNHRGNRHRRISVDMRARKRFDDGANQHCGRNAGVRYRIHRSRFYRVRSYALAVYAVKHSHARLNGNRRGESCPHRNVHIHFHGRDRAFQPARKHFRADGDNHRAEYKSSDIFVPPVSERVFVIGGARRERGRYYRDHRNRRVRQVVERVRSYRRRIGKHARNELCRAERDIERKSDCERDERGFCP